MSATKREAAAPEDLPAMATSQPHRAEQIAKHFVAFTDDLLTASYAHHALGLLYRDRGESAHALVELRLALRAARRSGSTERTADVRATLGTALAMAGRTTSGLGELDTAIVEASGSLLARVLLRRGFVLSEIGRYDEALSDVRHALAGIRAAGDTSWEALALNNRSAIHLQRGALARADEDACRSEQLFLCAGQVIEATWALHNQGAIAYCRGDLPGALDLYARTALRSSTLEVSWPELAFDRCQTYLAAGLTDQAIGVVSEALAGPDVSPIRRAELLYVAATAELARGEVEAALRSGRLARNLFRHQQRDWWQARAELTVLRARRLRGDSGAALAEQAGELGHRLAVMRSEDAPVALVVAGELALRHQPERAHQHFLAAARYRTNASALVRATGWLAQALDREAMGKGRGVLHACGQGLDALDEHRTTLGSSELRALATGHGTDLADLALRQAVRSGGARRVLAWSERWRATALAEPPVRPPRQSAAADDLAVLRTRTRLLDEARKEGRDGAALTRERLALEKAVRARRHQLAGVRRAGRTRFDVHALIAELGETTFVELVVVDEALHAVSVRNGRVRARVVGPVAAADQALAAAHFVLRQIGRGRPGDLGGIGDRLQRTVLGDTRLGDGPVVVAPPSRLHAVPWGLLPVLADRAVSVVPSAAMWLRARAAMRPADDRLVLIAGPDLGTGGAEVKVLADADPGAVLLRDGAATVEASLAALNGARLAHVAAHGVFRPDSPMFSSLILDDGPLTVHDLELLDVAPHHLVLSACDSGVMVPVGADELLGLTSALLSLGTAGVAASVAEVNDDATVEVMLDLHSALAGGADLAGAMHVARTRARGDVLREATAAAFVALGV